MKRFLFISVLIVTFSLTTNAQESSLDTWSIGIGATNTIMHGDLYSIHNDADFFNVGFYVSLNKMISPAFGFELKGQVLNLSGTAQDFSSAYPILYTDRLLGETYFEGETFGGELNLVLNLNGLAKNPYAKKERKLNVLTYLGIGYHSYTSKLYDKETNEVLIDYANVIGRDGNAKSMYFNTGLGLRYKLSNRLDIELRQNINFNNEDNLDAAISDKQNYETFFTTNLGIAFKLNKNGDKNIIWQDNNDESEPTIIEAKEEVKETPVLTLEDDDKDGVINQFDKEKNTPEGAIVYGNGIAIDTDKDGVIDLYDKCPLKPSNTKDGCPEVLDTDQDGVPDNIDLCINVKGTKANRGCPEEKNAITEVEKTTIISLAKNIYFASGKAILSDLSKKELEKIANIMYDNSNASFIIEGHTDSGGDKDYNIRLSQDRANAVMNYLIKLGVRPSNLKSIGYGFSKPLYNNRSSDGRQLNRRVEIRYIEGGFENYKEPIIVLRANEHIIKKKETLSSIAKKYKITIKQLIQWNNLKNNRIIIGDKLIIRK